MTILIIDDESDVRRVLGLRLQMEGFSIETVPSARSAFQRLHERAGADGHEAVDLILMDILMPDMSGIEACRYLKNDPRTAVIPVIMMTASSDSEHLQEAFSAGAADYLTKPFSRVELLARIRAALRVSSELARHRKNEQQLALTTEKLKFINSHLERLSAMDGLTGVYNRRHFDEVLGREYRRAGRAQTPLALIMADIDWFKMFNDRYGHQAGDACLQQVAAVFNKLVHRSHDLVARYGGEEFAVILPETPVAGALEMAHALRSGIAALQLVGANGLQPGAVTASLGVACVVPRAGTGPEVLIELADRALYQSKQAGRNRVTAAPGSQT